MQVLSIKAYSLYSHKNNKQNPCGIRRFDRMTEDSCDFGYYDISFAGTTSAGKPLKQLVDITCPYRGVKVIPGTVCKVFDRALEHCTGAKEIVYLLSRYSKHFLPTEKSIFAIFKDFSELNPKDSLENCLRMMYTSCLTKLKLEEFEVLDKVDQMSRKLSPATALRLREKTTKCRSIILNDSERDCFKRKTFLVSLDEIHPNENEREIFERIRNQALFLPTSGSSKNAFVVKYAQRSQQEAARRIFIGSTGSLEHITPDSKGGANAIGNFLLTTADGNRYRENMPLPAYIQRHPNIPNYMQMYIDDVIRNIHEGKLKGNETYPYKIKQKLKDESNGRIMLSLSKYAYTEQEAKQLVREYETRWHKYKKQKHPY